MWVIQRLTGAIEIGQTLDSLDQELLVKIAVRKNATTNALATGTRSNALDELVPFGQTCLYVQSESAEKESKPATRADASDDIENIARSRLRGSLVGFFDGFKQFIQDQKGGNGLKPPTVNGEDLKRLFVVHVRENKMGLMEGVKIGAKRDVYRSK